MWQLGNTTKSQWNYYMKSIVPNNNKVSLISKRTHLPIDNITLFYTIDKEGVLASSHFYGCFFCEANYHILNIRYMYSEQH